MESGNDAWTEDGVAMVSMHWEGYPDKDNAIMTEASISSSTMTLNKK